MKSLSKHILLLIALILSALPPVTPARAAAPVQAGGVASRGVSPEGMLNPDGTLNLDGSFNGELNLSGYSVEIDPLRGPVFGAERSATSAAPTTGQWDGLGSSSQALNGQVMAIVVSGSDVYIGGSFRDAANIPEADAIVKWNGTIWSALGDNGAGSGALGNQVNAIAVIGTDVYAAGYFIDVNNHGAILTDADYIAKWDGANWSALGSSAINYIVSALAVIGTDLYVGGLFQNAAGLTAADYLAKWDSLTSQWSALGGDNFGGGALNSSVYALAVDGSGNLYAGGNFTDIKAGIFTINTADYLAKWTPSGGSGTWSAIGSNGNSNGSLNGAVYAIAVSGADVYVGGDFTDVRNGLLMLSSADYIARWDGAAWHPLGTGVAPDYGSLNNRVSSILVNGSDVYVGGEFYNVHNGATLIVRADHLAHWDGVNWSGLGSSGGGTSVFTFSTNAPINVFALAFFNGNLLAGGNMDVIRNNSVWLSGQYLVSWDGTNWTSPSSVLPGGSLNNVVRAIAISGTDVYVGGNFMDVANGAVSLPAADNIAKWNGTAWSALGQGTQGNGSINNTVYAITVSGTNVYVGGDFHNVDNNGTLLSAADNIAKWDTLTGNWSALGENGSGDGSLNAPVTALAVSGSTLYAGGEFFNVNNHGNVWGSADFIAKWDGTDWMPLSGNGSGDGSLNSHVQALAISGSNLYVGGNFTNVNNGGDLLGAADCIARWDTLSGNWFALGDNGANPADGSLNSAVYALAVSGTNVYAGGTFHDVNNHGTVLPAADKIAKWDTLTSNWSALGQDASGNGVFKTPNWIIYSIVVSGNNVYAGGFFWDLNNKLQLLPAADNIARWDGTNWNALGSNGAGNGSIQDVTFALALSGSTLYAGGGFADIKTGGTTLTNADFIAAYGIDPTFADVPFGYWSHGYIERLYNAGITGGCTTTPLNYCPTTPVTRAQMAIFLLRGMHGSSYIPPAATGTKFTDVPLGTFGAAWIEQLAAEGITSGCGGGKYCPTQSVSRAQMAVFLVRAKHGIAFVPPTATGIFPDVPVGSFGANYIEQLVTDGITSGCGGGLYCPNTMVKRDSMAVFLVKTFSLP
jgi:trimeric autotransporter adhesin